MQLHAAAIYLYTHISIEPRDHGIAYRTLVLSVTRQHIIVRIHPSLNQLSQMSVWQANVKLCPLHHPIQPPPPSIPDQHKLRVHVVKSDDHLAAIYNDTIRCTFVFLCDILLPSGVINDDTIG